MLCIKLIGTKLVAEFEGTELHSTQYPNRELAVEIYFGVCLALRVRKMLADTSCIVS